MDQISLGVSRFSLVTIVISVLHYHINLILPLSEGQAGGARKPSRKVMVLLKSGALRVKLLLLSVLQLPKS